VSNVKLVFFSGIPGNYVGQSVTMVSEVGFNPMVADESYLPYLKDTGIQRGGVCLSNQECQKN
jgi:hypothetical protein